MSVESSQEAMSVESSQGSLPLELVPTGISQELVNLEIRTNSQDSEEMAINSQLIRTEGRYYYQNHRVSERMAERV